MPRRILFTFTGFHDPYAKSPIEGEEQPGPILTVLKHREFNRVVLFGTPRMVDVTRATVDAITDSMPEVTPDVVQLPLEDPTDYAQILAHLRAHCGRII